jgi:hypothetical protein
MIRAALAMICVSVPMLSLAVLFGGGCKTAPPSHQKGGSTMQSLSHLLSADQEYSVPAPLPNAPTQILQQPENPEGTSVQSLVRTTTTTQPDGSVTTTTERAETSIGGSQDLADIIKEYLGAEYMKRLSIALIMALIAFKVRREWPMIAGVLAIGALIVAYFGLAYVVAISSAAGGLFVAYYVVKSKLTIPLT